MVISIETFILLAEAKYSKETIIRTTRTANLETLTTVLQLYLSWFKDDNSKVAAGYMHTILTSFICMNRFIK